jgi:hypothetical protein
MGLFDFIGDIFGGSDKETTQTQQNDIRQLPDYNEATMAREGWWNTLEKWGNQPGYGAVSPDFNSIWENARSRVQRYFNGGPEGPGLNAKVKANSARRGVGDSATGDSMLQKSGFQQGNMLMDLAVKQAIEEANLAESGRKTWLGSMKNLAGLKPSFQNYGSKTTSETYKNPLSDIMGGLSGGGSGGSGGSGFDLDSLSQMFGEGGGYGGDTGIGDVTGMNAGDEEDAEFGVDDGINIATAIARMFGGDIIGGGSQLASTGMKFL